MQIVDLAYPGLVTVLLQLGVVSACNDESQRTPGEKAAQITELIQQAEFYFEKSEFPQAQGLTEQALAKAEQQHDTYGIAQAQCLLGSIYSAQRQPGKALELFDSSLQWSKANGYDDLVAMNQFRSSIYSSSAEDLQRGIQECQQAISFFKKTNNQKQEALANYYLGINFRNKNDFERALLQDSMVISVSQPIDYYWGMASAHIMSGVMLGQRGQNERAIQHFDTALELWKQMENVSEEAATYHMLGNVHFQQRDYPTALNYYLRSLDIRKDQKDSLKIGEGYHDIGHIYLNRGNYNEALKNYQIALKIFQSSGNQQRTGMAYNSLGLAYTELGDSTSAIQNFEASLGILEALHDQLNLVYTLTNIGRLYTGIKNFENARPKLLAAIRIGHEIHNDEVLSLAYSHLGILDFFTHHLPDARESLTTSISLASGTGDKDVLKHDYEFLSKVDSAQNQFEPALEHYKMHKVYADSIFSADKEKIIQDLKINYETREKDEKIELQKMQLTRQANIKNYLIGGFILFAVLSFFAYNYYITRQKLKLQTLRNKIASDLHDDVGSTLSSIAIFSEMAQQQSREVIPLLTTIEQSSRKMLDAMADIVWTINPENDQFEKIILRMKSYAYELLGAKQIDFDFNASVDIGQIRLPMSVRKNLYLIFKEATNNLVKYAEADKVLFTISEEKNQLSMVIKDNGRGFDVNEVALGNGLRNMQKRAVEVGGKLWIESFPGLGTSIIFKIQV